jgi:hypothetical protein
MRIRRLFVLAAVAALAGAAAPPSLQAQVSSARLIREARDWLTNLEADSAVRLLRRVVGPESGATAEERLRAFVLLAVAELSVDRSAAANAWADSAIGLSPSERADSLEAAGLAAGVNEVFAAARRRYESHRAVLEFQGLPAGAQLRVNGGVWTTTRADLPPGPVRVEVSQRGYRTWTDSFDLAAGRPEIRAIPALFRLETAILTVSSDPAGIVLLGDVRVGETPLVAAPVDAGRFVLRVLTPTGDTIATTPVELEPGRARVVGTLGRAAPASGTGAAVADSLYRAAAFDAALTAYAAALREGGAAMPVARRVRILNRMGVVSYAIGRSRGQPAFLDSARSYFRQAVRAAPDLTPSVAEYAPGFRAAMDSARASLLLVALDALRDTTLAPRDAALRLVVRPSLPSRVSVTIVPAGGAGAALHTDSQAVAFPNQATTFTWNVRTPAGTLAVGRYVLRVVAHDSAGQTSPPVERPFAVALLPVDTTAHPTAPRPSDFAPESTTIRPKSLTSLGVGLAAAGVAAALPSALGNSDLNRGRARDATVYGVAGVVSIAAIAGFLSGTRTLPLPENAERNRRLREQYQTQRAAVVAQNRRLFDEAPVVLRFEGGP